MAHVVGAVRVLPIPARGKSDDRPDAADAEPGGQSLAVWGCAVEVEIVPRCWHAAVANLLCRAWGVRRGVADKHAKARRERCDVDGRIR